MPPTGSVTGWIEQLKAGGQAAVQQIWQGYFQRLVGLARARTNDEVAARLGRSPAPVERKLKLIRNLWEKENTP
jgi:hypothetical protein